MLFTCQSGCHPQLQEQVEVVSRSLPAELEWGQVLVEAKVAPITPADVYTIRLGGVYDEDHRQPPFVSGHEFVAVVTQVSVIIVLLVMQLPRLYVTGKPGAVQAI